jgi:hypothetical protein
MQTGRDHSSFNLETGKVARVFTVPHIDPEPDPETSGSRASRPPQPQGPKCGGY